MERIIWYILYSYKQLFCDENYNTEDRQDGYVLLESAIMGGLLYARESKISESDFYDLYIEKINDYALKNGEISIEVLCYIAASLRGDFAKNKNDIGKFFGESARKLGLTTDVFKKHEIPSGQALSVFGKMTLLDYLSRK
jgi:hypothetical protein